MVEPSAELGACGAGRCRARVRWVRLVRGGDVPVDVTLEAGGPLVPVIDARGRRRVRGREPGDDPARPGFVEHWQTCPDPAFWAGRRALADVAGVTAPVRRPAQRRAGAGPLGPCAGCRRPGLAVYGPDSSGPLCPACAAILAAWRRTRQGPLIYPRWEHR